MASIPPLTVDPQLLRQRARARHAKEFSSPADFAVMAGRGRWWVKPHLQLISDTIVERLEAGNARILVTLPPRHGKSQLISQYTPAWYLIRNPSKHIILASYQAGFAAGWGRRARRLVEEYGPVCGVEVDEQSKAADRWDIAGWGGGMVTAGVGGPITGRGADVFIVDDLVKNAQDANSRIIQERNWEWWQSTAFTRLEPGGSVLGMMTRWNERDWIGRLKEQAEEEGEEWLIINLPALAEDNDPLGRKPGEPLWPERYPEARLERIRENIGSYYWSALYQQNPTPAEGGMFQRDRFRYYETVTEYDAEGGETKFYRLWDQLGNVEQFPVDECTRIATVDLAASEREQADYTVILTCAITPKKQLLVLDMFRRRLPGPEQIPAMQREYFRNRPQYLAIEATAYQLTAVQNARQAGLPVRELRADRDKVARATTLGVRYEAGQVYHPAKTKWVLDLEGELLSFPRGQHDDIVDALAYAALEVAQSGSKYHVGVV